MPALFPDDQKKDYKSFLAVLKQAKIYVSICGPIVKIILCIVINVKHIFGYNVFTITLKL